MTSKKDSKCILKCRFPMPLPSEGNWNIGYIIIVIIHAYGV